MAKRKKKSEGPPIRLPPPPGEPEWVSKPAARSALRERARDAIKKERRHFSTGKLDRELDKANFLIAFKERQVMSYACEAVGRSRDWVYDQFKNDPVFKAKFDEARQRVVEEVEDATLRIAKEGYERPVFQNGRLVGTERCWHPGINMFVLSKRLRGVYGDDLDQKIAELEAKLQQLRELKRGAKAAKAADKAEKDVTEDGDADAQ